jgi:hypothetical protein
MCYGAKTLQLRGNWVAPRERSAMEIVQRPSAVLLLTAAMILAAVSSSHAEMGVAPVIGDGAYQNAPRSPAGDFHSQGRIESAQADTPAAAPPPADTAPAATPPGSAKPQDGKPADNSGTAPANANVAPVNQAVFPTAVDPKYIHELGPLGRLRTCADQFTANKATNSNGGMKWIDRSGGYYLQCSRRLKG